MSTSTIDSPTTTGPGTLDVVQTVPVPRLADPGDHDTFSHYVNRKVLTDATIFGFEVEALCGKKWVPVKDPNRYPVCPSCRDRYNAQPIGPDDDPRDDSGRTNL